MTRLESFLAIRFNSNVDDRVGVWLLEELEESLWIFPRTVHRTFLFPFLQGKVLSLARIGDLRFTNGLARVTDAENK